MDNAILISYTQTLVTMSHVNAAHPIIYNGSGHQLLRKPRGLVVILLRHSMVYLDAVPDGLAIQKSLVTPSLKVFQQYESYARRVCWAR